MTSPTPATTVTSSSSLVACDLADLLVSGLTGLRLMRELRERFPHANRTDVFFGVAIAISLLEAERVELVCELQIAGRDLVKNSSSSAG